MPYNPQRRSAGINKGKRTPEGMRLKPGPHELAQQHPQRGVKYDLVMHQMMSCPREVGGRTINQLALTFGTLLSSQSTGAHRWKSLDRLRGNLIYVTGWPRQLQIVSACRSRLARRSVLRLLRVRGVGCRGVPWADQLSDLSRVRPPLCGSPWGMDEVTGSLPLASNPQVSSDFHDHRSESVQVRGGGSDAQRGW